MPRGIAHPHATSHRHSWVVSAAPAGQTGPQLTVSRIVGCEGEGEDHERDAQEQTAHSGRLRATYVHGRSGGPSLEAAADTPSVRCSKLTLALRQFQTRVRKGQEGLVVRLTLDGGWYRERASTRPVSPS